MKTLYHGSKDIIKVPIYGKGKLYNDYGLGFYCTEDLDLAMEWAVDLDRNGYANQYEIDETQLSILKQFKIEDGFILFTVSAQKAVQIHTCSNRSQIVNIRAAKVNDMLTHLALSAIIVIENLNGGCCYVCCKFCAGWSKYSKRIRQTFNDPAKSG